MCKCDSLGAIKRIIYFFLLGFSGNQPFSTRFFCWKISSMLQSDENSKMPNRLDIRIFVVNIESVIPVNPPTRKNH